jgi:hypothetical protein
MTGATNGTETASPSCAHKFIPVIIGVRVVQTLFVYVVFFDHCLLLCNFSIAHCIVYHIRVLLTPCYILELFPVTPCD